MSEWKALPEEERAATPRPLNMNDPALTHKMAYLFGLGLVSATYGALYSYLRTRKAPEEPKDYFYPKTGGYNVDGSEERLALPLYIRDIMSYKTDPLLAVSHKLNPVLTQAVDIFVKNSDFMGQEIRDPDDTYLQQGKDVLSYLLKQNMTFSIQGMLRGKHSPEGKIPAWVNLIGIQAAPSYITKTPAEREISALQAGRGGTPGSRTPEEAERAKLRREETGRLRAADARGGDPQPIMDAIGAAVTSGRLTDADEKRIYRDSGKKPFELQFAGLRVQDAFHVWDKQANDEQKRLVVDDLEDKIDRSEKAGNIPPEKADQYMARINQWRSGKLTSGGGWAAIFGR
jgi:hypothetical protein